VTVVATCRGDEAPLDDPVVSWLAHVRGSGPVAEIRLGPLSRAEVGEQVAALAGGPVSGGLAAARALSRSTALTLTGGSQRGSSPARCHTLEIAERAPVGV